MFEIAQARSTVRTLDPLPARGGGWNGWLTTPLKRAKKKNNKRIEIENKYKETGQVLKKYIIFRQPC